MLPTYIDDDAVAASLSMDDAIECVDRAFRLLAAGDAVNAVRRRVSCGEATLHVMWAIAPTEGFMGVKEYPTVRGSTRGAVLTVLLHDVSSGELVALVRGDHLGQLRTAAASAVATRALARPDSRVLSVFGTGFQAEWHVVALSSVMPDLQAVHVVGRTPGKKEDLIRRLRQRLDVDIHASEPRVAAQAADVMVTVTDSPEPIVFGDWLRPGVHINAVGSNKPHHRELDAEVVRRADAIIVDSRDVARVECGDLIVNGIDIADAVELGDVLDGRAPGRVHPGDVTVFESHGLALQDVVCAGHVYRALGRTSEGASHGCVSDVDA